MIYLDTNILVYLLEGGYPFTISVAEELEKAHARGEGLITSVISLTEFMAGRPKTASNAVKTVPFLSLLPVDATIASTAATFQREHGLAIGDALHLATSIEYDCETLFTNDAKLAKAATKYVNVLQPVAA